MRSLFQVVSTRKSPAHLATAFAILVIATGCDADRTAAQRAFIAAAILALAATLNLRTGGLARVFCSLARVQRTRAADAVFARTAGLTLRLVLFGRFAFDS